LYPPVPAVQSGAFGPPQAYPILPGIHYGMPVGAAADASQLSYQYYYPDTSMQPVMGYPMAVPYPQYQDAENQRNVMAVPPPVAKEEQRAAKRAAPTPDSSVTSSTRSGASHRTHRKRRPYAKRLGLMWDSSTKEYVPQEDGSDPTMAPQSNQPKVPPPDGPSRRKVPQQKGPKVPRRNGPNPQRKGLPKKNGPRSQKVPKLNNARDFPPLDITLVMDAPSKSNPPKSEPTTLAQKKCQKKNNFKKTKNKGKAAYQKGVMEDKTKSDVTVSDITHGMNEVKVDDA
jgi:hypothetical protein